MGDSWQVLLEAGLPDGAVRPPPSPPLDTAQIAKAVADVGRDLDQLRAEAREALLAWLRAFRHHWPAAFAEALGSEGDRLVETLEGGGIDPNRYLKLRRIAIENLSHVL